MIAQMALRRIQYMLTTFAVHFFREPTANRKINSINFYTILDNQKELELELKLSHL